MYRKIEIRLECPICSHSICVDATKRYDNIVCSECDNQGIFLEPKEIINTFINKYSDWSKGEDSPYTILYPLYHTDNRDEETEKEYPMDINHEIMKELQDNNVIAQEYWSLDYTIAKFVLPRLNKWLEHGINGFPADLTEKKWLEILNKIKYSMQKIVDDDSYSKEEYEKIQEGLNLFGKWFRGMWD